ncbi:hypothetical protein OG216_46460 (plasmid) [Streptomycetaceae bacterium NBC_01309]
MRTRTSAHSQHIGRRPLRAAIAVTCVGLLLGACGNGGGGIAVTPFGSAAQPGTSKDASPANGRIDARTADPCSFVPHDALAPFAAKAPLPDTDAATAQETITSTPGADYNYCIVYVRTAVGGTVHISVDLATVPVDEDALANLSAGVTVRESNGLRIVSIKHSGAAGIPCRRGLVDTESMVTTIDAVGDVAAARADVCAIADAVAEAGSKVVAEGRLTARTYGPQSFARLRACDLIADTTLAKVPDMRPTKTPTAPGFACTIGPTDKDSTATSALVRLAVSSLQYVNAPPARRTQIAGRESVVKYLEKDRSSDLPGRCSVTTTGIELPGTGMLEVAEVLVLAPDNPDKERVCAAAQAIAVDVWPRLPK